MVSRRNKDCEEGTETNEKVNQPLFLDAPGLQEAEEDIKAVFTPTVMWCSRPI